MKLSYDQLEEQLNPIWARLNTQEDTGDIKLFDPIFETIKAAGWTPDEYYAGFWLDSLSPKKVRKDIKVWNSRKQQYVRSRR